MENSLILETTFLIDLGREIAGSKSGIAFRFLDEHPGHRLYITPTIAGELAAGTSLDERQMWEQFIAPFQILTCSKEVCWEYGRAYRYLRENGLLIGSNDLWIAATALAYQVPVVTRNLKHYGRVPGLRLAEYRSPVV